METLRDIPGYEGRYAVTKDGRVWSYPKKLSPHGRFLKPKKKTTGYLRVKLSGPGKYTIREFTVHRLVVISFLEKDVERSDINHKNGVKDDNRVENLEWNTRKENIHHAMINGLRGKISRECCESKGPKHMKTCKDVHSIPKKG